MELKRVFKALGLSFLGAAMGVQAEAADLGFDLRGCFNFGKLELCGSTNTGNNHRHGNHGHDERRRYRLVEVERGPRGHICPQGTIRTHDGNIYPGTNGGTVYCSVRRYDR